MKIALISDIHSNLDYLITVLNNLNNKVDKIYCLGDIIGYYDKPNEVIDIIKQNDITCIKGNHEKYILGEISYDKTKDALYRLEEQKHIISSENLHYISKLDEEIVLNINNRKIYMTHSLPMDCETYLYNMEQFNFSLLDKYDYYFFGHTHIPIIFYKFGTCIVNPGSVGQPRDYTQKSSYAIVDFDLDQVVIKKIKQNIDGLINRLNNKHYSNAVIEILKRVKNGKN
ncbi:metallophosphoesterase family protein [Campylobacter hyointestinalis]|uniref:metallophosphoesterase family protein n=1 Tax=Campylobacter hyointestinalis TaxID=198 RepID=UPI000DCBE49A|nr:metallophosphoesterase family protein [Campylobacter hyointestinalis]RAZ51778.1 hypothetical protein CHL10075_05710 [Campylobacter hyointestinalis subsp. lawsonii]